MLAARTSSHQSRTLICPRMPMMAMFSAARRQLLGADEAVAVRGALAGDLDRRVEMGVDLEVAHSLLGAEEARQGAGARDPRGGRRPTVIGMAPASRIAWIACFDGLVRPCQVADHDRRVAAVDEVVVASNRSTSQSNDQGSPSSRRCGAPAGRWRSPGARSLVAALEREAEERRLGAAAPPGSRDRHVACPEQRDHARRQREGVTRLHSRRYHPAYQRAEHDAEQPARDQHGAVEPLDDGRVSTHAKAAVHAPIDAIDIGAKTPQRGAASSRPGNAAISSTTTGPVPARPWMRPIDAACPRVLIWTCR